MRNNKKASALINLLVRRLIIQMLFGDRDNLLEALCSLAIALCIENCLELLPDRKTRRVVKRTKDSKASR